MSQPLACDILAVDGTRTRSSAIPMGEFADP